MSENSTGTNTNNDPGNPPNLVGLLIRVFKRWMEEPIGLAFGLVVFFALRVPEQTADMLTEVAYLDGFISTENPLNFAELTKGVSKNTGFDLLECVWFSLGGLTLANSVWYWLTTVNRTEICIQGGRLEDYNFLDLIKRSTSNAKEAIKQEELKQKAIKQLDEMMPFGVWPYRMASSAAAWMIILSVVSSVLGLKINSSYAVVLELLLLMMFSLGLGYWFAAITGDQIRKTVSNKKRPELLTETEIATHTRALRVYHLEWLNSLKNGSAGLRIWQIGRYARLLQVGHLTLWASLGISVLIFIFLMQLDNLDAFSEGMLTVLLVVPCLVFVNVFCLTNIWAGLVWRKKVSGLQKADLDKFVTSARHEFVKIDKNLRRRAYRASALIIGFFWLFLLGIILFPPSEDQITFPTSFLPLSPKIILLSMAIAIGPLVLVHICLRHAYRVSALIIGLFWLFLLGVILWPDPERRIAFPSSFLPSSPTIILLSMAIAVGPLVLVLTFLRDFWERVLLWVPFGFRKFWRGMKILWRGSMKIFGRRTIDRPKNYAELQLSSFAQRPRENAHPARVLGRGFAITTLALFLLFPFDIFENVTTLKPFRSDKEVDLYEIKKMGEALTADSRPEVKKLWRIGVKPSLQSIVLLPRRSKKYP